VRNNDNQSNSNDSDEHDSNDNHEVSSANAQPPKTTGQVMQCLIHLVFYPQLSNVRSC